MGSYSCPICDEDVAPIAWLERMSASDELLAVASPAHGAGHVPLERRTCPTCGSRLERTPPERWHVAA